MKITSIIGARPQFIKSSVVSNTIRKYGIDEIVIHTGQHFDHSMSKIFFDELNLLPPKYNLNINSLSHGAMTGNMIREIESILIDEKPDIVLLFGDTNSTLAGAIAAKKLNVKIAHIEAGLRSHNMKMPEEVNRILTDRISDILFCPTQNAINNLINEGFSNFNCEIVNCGDVMFEAALQYSKIAKSPILKLPKKFILSTIHREENTDNIDNLKNIIQSLVDISKNIPIILPIHPRTRKKLNDYKIDIKNRNIIQIEPIGYLEMIYLLQHCEFVITDSGGLQKEAYFFKKICITLRNETEWTELVDYKYNFLCGCEREKILDSLNNIQKNKKMFQPFLYGKGNASEIIINTLLS